MYGVHYSGEKQIRANICRGELLDVVAVYHSRATLVISN